MLLFDNYEWSIFHNALTSLHADSSNLTILLSLDIVSHFHSFEDKNGVASLYFVAYGNLDFCNNTRKWRLNSICCIYVCSACCRLFACSLLVRIAENNLLLFRLLLRFHFYFVGLAVDCYFSNIINNLAYFDFIFYSVDSILIFFHLYCLLKIGRKHCVVKASV